MDLFATAQSILGRSVVAGAMDMLTADLNMRLRVRQMETSATLAVGDPIPADFVEALRVDLDDTTLLPATEGNLADGAFCVVGDELLTTASTGALTLRYVARLATLASGETNAVLDAYPALYLYGLLRHHSALVRDDAGRQHWDALFEGALAEANKADVRSRQSEVSMRPVPRYSA